MVASAACAKSECASLTQELLHSGKALARGLLRRAPTLPMRFEAHCSTVPRLRQRAKLADVVEDSATHGGPLKTTVGLSQDVFAMHVPDALFRNCPEIIGKGSLASIGSVAGVPGQQ